MLLVPNSLYGLCGCKATLNQSTNYPRFVCNFMLVPLTGEGPLAHQRALFSAVGKAWKAWIRLNDDGCSFVPGFG